MSERQSGSRLRIRVEGGDGLVLDLDPVETPESPGRTPPVTDLPAGASERAMGRQGYEVTVDGWVLRVTVEPAELADLRERAGQSVVRRGPGGEITLWAQIPGRVVRLWVAEGDTVEVGQRLLAIEAMKMENDVRAPRAGQVSSIAVAVGAAVELGDELLTVR